MPSMYSQLPAARQRSSSSRSSSEGDLESIGRGSDEETNKLGTARAMRMDPESKAEYDVDDDSWCERTDDTVVSSVLIAC